MISSDDFLCLNEFICTALIVFVTNVFFVSSLMSCLEFTTVRTIYIMSDNNRLVSGDTCSTAPIICR